MSQQCQTTSVSHPHKSFLILSLSMPLPFAPDSSLAILHPSGKGISTWPLACCSTHCFIRQLNPCLLPLPGNTFSRRVWLRHVSLTPTLDLGFQRVLQAYPYTETWSPREALHGHMKYSIWGATSERSTHASAQHIAVSPAHAEPASSACGLWCLGHCLDD